MSACHRPVAPSTRAHATPSHGYERVPSRTRVGLLEGPVVHALNVTAAWICAAPPAVAAPDPPETLRRLYGDAFPLEAATNSPTNPENSTTNSGAIVVLGAHHSGTSLTTRLLMLLGAYAGHENQLLILESNPVK